jgi:hypothetical protein
LGLSLFTALRALRTCKQMELVLEPDASRMLLDLTRSLHDAGKFQHEMTDNRVAAIAGQVLDCGSELSVEARHLVIDQIEELVSAVS